MLSISVHTGKLTICLSFAFLQAASRIFQVSSVRVKPVTRSVYFFASTMVDDKLDIISGGKNGITWQNFVYSLVVSEFKLSLTTIDRMKAGTIMETAEIFFLSLVFFNTAAREDQTTPPQKNPVKCLLEVL